MIYQGSVLWRNKPMGERDYRFAKSEEQIRKINKFLCISTAILNVISFIIIFISYMRGYRTELYTFGLLAIMVITSIGGFIIYKKNYFLFKNNYSEPAKINKKRKKVNFF